MPDWLHSKVNEEGVTCIVVVSKEVNLQFFPFFFFRLLFSFPQEKKSVEDDTRRSWVMWCDEEYRKIEIAENAAHTLWLHILFTIH